MVTLSKKDMVMVNQEIGEEGILQNESSLELALSMTKTKKNWVYELAYLLRCLLVDQAFKDGNKRTSLALAILYIEDKNLKWDKERLVQIIYYLAKKNYKSIEKISRMIKDATY